MIFFMPFIILDRDGVINHDSNEYIKSPEEWIPIPGSLEAIAKLNRAHFQILIATNQSGIARGHYDLPMLEKIHEKLSQELALLGGSVKEIFFCPHHPKEQCPCRKPKPGLLYQMQAKYPIHFPETFFIGDSMVDVEAALSVNCIPLLVLTGRGQSSKEKFKSVPAFSDLNHAADYVIEISHA